MFIKPSLKTQKIFKKLEIMKLELEFRNWKCNLYLHFFIQQNLSISSEKILMSAELKGCFT